MTQVWEQLEGVSLAGEYGLQQCLGGDASGAYFRTTFGPERQPALLKLIPEGSFAAEARLAMWRRTTRLAHPGLLALLDCGRASSGGDVFLYAVFEHPDDSLAGALQNGPFTEDEARDVLDAALDALRYIHRERLVHSSIDAEHIVAVGDRIKLASDTLKDARESQTTYVDDIRALGALIDTLVSVKSDPLRTTIQRALEEAAALPPARVSEAPAASAPVEPKRPAAEPLVRNRPHVARYVPLVAALATALLAGVVVVKNRSTPVTDAPVAAVAPPVTAPRTGAVAPSPVAAPPPVAVPRPSPMATAPAAKSPASTTSAAVKAPAPTTTAAAPPPGAKAPAPTTPAAAPPPAVKTPAPTTPAKQPLQTWRVIAYTYSQYKDAEKKAKSINAKFPGLHAEVFTLKRSPVPYLVSLGAHLTRDEAAALQKKVIARGLASDTFIRNFAD